MTVGDLEKLLEEKKKGAEPSSARQGSEAGSAQQDQQMEQRAAELAEMKDAASERRSLLLKEAAEAKDAADRGVRYLMTSLDLGGVAAL